MLQNFYGPVYIVCVDFFTMETQEWEQQEDWHTVWMFVNVPGLLESLKESIKTDLPINGMFEENLRYFIIDAEKDPVLYYALKERQTREFSTLMKKDRLLESLSKCIEFTPED